ncbi:nucleotidyltransferase family protein [Sulfurospirillum diekertiae]|uniref:Nucleotidyltransferase domain-containing protein n=1 Tax=Sulfurospirillum diekertiae TaxID=1854492 RepID=A0AA92IZT3_9BACT|nr:nucleotidyltransferase domain-containing protein [Sulfurospirillum diekertiae]QIR76876.1 nucleotidyltransferase domain-containing protein [Sulfurospirillum diekertiae]
MGYLEVLSTLAQLKTKYNIPELYLFGSFAKHQDNENSDVDIAVKLEKADAFLLVRIIMQEAQEKLHRNVDIVQLRERMNPLLKKVILEEGVRV